MVTALRIIYIYIANLQNSPLFMQPSSVRPVPCISLDFTDRRFSFSGASYIEASASRTPPVDQVFTDYGNIVWYAATRVQAGGDGTDSGEDVQLTKDHVPVIYHDFLVGETGIDAPVHTMTLEQVRAASID